MIQKFFLAFIPIFVAIDPIGLVAIFTGLAANASPEQRKRQAFLGILTALCVAVGFQRKTSTPSHSVSWFAGL